MVMTLLTAACGGSRPTGGSTLQQEELAAAQCMRSHGVPNFPDPPANGSLPPVGPEILGVSNTAYTSAVNACRHLAPSAGPAAGGAAQTHSQLLRFAQCMRSHGVVNFPDPDSIGLRVLPSMTRSPQYRRAYPTCESMLPRNDGAVKGVVPGGGS
jgi:hypothetical protein